MSGAARILFVADAGPQVGGGHVMRSLTLARAMVELGAHCAFLDGPGVAAILDAFAADIPRIATDDLSEAEILAATGADVFNAVVFDHYGLSADDHRDLARGRPTLVIDDLADRPLAADLVVDSGPQRRAADYQGLIPAGARLLLGAAYAPVRPEFAELRAKTLGRRPEAVGRILVSLGLTDLGGITGRVLDRLRPRIGQTAIDVVLGAGATSRAGLERLARRDPRLTVHVDTPDMARLTAAADLAVGAAGSSAWERCTLALPSVMLVVADNQRPAATALAEAGAALVVEADDPAFDQLFDRAFLRLFTDPVARGRLAAKCAEVCDGLGAERVADVFLDLLLARLGPSAPTIEPG